MHAEGFTGFKAEMVGISIGAADLSVGATGIKLEVTGLANEDKPIKITKASLMAATNAISTWAGGPKIFS